MTTSPSRALHPAPRPSERWARAVAACTMPDASILARTLAWAHLCTLRGTAFHQSRIVPPAPALRPARGIPTTEEDGA